MTQPLSYVAFLLILAVPILADRHRSVFPYSGYEREAACEKLCGSNDYEEKSIVTGLTARGSRPKPDPRFPPCTNPVGCQANGHIKAWVLSWFKPSPPPPPPPTPRPIMQPPPPIRRPPPPIMQRPPPPYRPQSYPADIGYKYSYGYHGQPPPPRRPPPPPVYVPQSNPDNPWYSHYK